MAEFSEIWNPHFQPPQQPFEKNKFIFVNRNKEYSLPKPNTVLVNPHFKENKTVFLNPKFQMSRNDITSSSKVYVNPNVLRSITPEVKTVAVNPAFFQKTVPSREPVFKKINYAYNQTVEPTSVTGDNTSDSYRKVNTNCSRGKILHTKNKIINGLQCSQVKPSENDLKRKVHTRLKIVNVPKSPIITPKNNTQAKDVSVFTRFKYIRKIVSPSSSKTTDLKKSTNHDDSFGYSHKNNSVKKNAVMTRFKYVRNVTKLTKIQKSPMKSKYKIVNNSSPKANQEKKLNSSLYRKKYVFLNKYNSSSFLANNVILKNAKQRYVKINGILYQNSPCVLKKVSSQQKKNLSGGSKGKYRIVRSNSTSAAKLKKSNVACPVFRRTGKCNGFKKGTCIKVHNPNLIVLCKSFLRGECQNDNCLLSHKVSSEKMPTCKYFLEGLCNKVDCQYLHVKISPNAEICKDFLEGFCKEGIKCDKRHQFLCPEYEKTKKCTKPKCIYPHGTSEPKRVKKNHKIIARKNNVKPPEQKVEDVNLQIRYYKDKTESSNEPETSNEAWTIPKREKLGSLPSFIPIS